MKSLIQDEIRPAVEQAIRDSGILDDYTVEVTLDLVPGPQGPQPVIMLFIAIPNPGEIGKHISSMTILPGPRPEDLAISTAVLGLLNDLGVRRHEALTAK